MTGDGIRTRRRLAALAAVAVLATTGAVAVAADAPPPAAECVTAGQSSPLPCDAVAVVGDEPIPKTEYDHWFAIAVRSNRGSATPALEPPRFTECAAAKFDTLPRKQRRPSARERLRRQCAAEHRALLEQVMQLLISFRWIRGEAAEQGVTVSRSEVRAQYREQKRASFPREKDYERFLRQSGQTESDILMRVELDVLSNRLRERTIRDAPPVSRREIGRYYRRNRERFALPERRDLRVVLARTEARADAARARIEAGERWATVAKDLSIDPSTRARGGRLRAVAEGQQERRFDRAIFAAERRQLEGPVRTRFGYYVFRVTRIKPATQLPLRRVRPTITQLLRSQREQQALDRFVERFTKRWRARTICREGYRVSDCSNAPAA